MSSCSGCFPNYQPNQMAHMERGGCMYVDEDIFCLPVNLEVHFDSVVDSESTSEISGFDSASVGTECCICYEIIGKKNNCVTECGHVFCFKCLATAMAHNNSCPCCRATLVDLPAEDDDESEYVSDEDDEEDDEDDEDEITANKEYVGDVEDIVARIESKGYTMLDIVSLLFNKFSKKDEKYTHEYVKNLCDTVDQMNLDTELESKERENMGVEDAPILARLGGPIVDIVL